MSSSDLVDYLKIIGAIKSSSIYKAFSEIDRKEFVSAWNINRAYSDRALPIGHGQTISQPYTVAFMLDLLRPLKGQKILDVGSGSGWTTALLAKIVGPSGKVIGLERIPDLVRFGQKNLAKYNFPWASIQKAKKNYFGDNNFAPYDRILVSASASELPGDLLKQLSAPGKLVIPIGSAIFLAEKNKNGNTRLERHDGFVFVPLLN